jgi:hypothetical protein
VSYKQDEYEENDIFSYRQTAMSQRQRKSLKTTRRGKILDIGKQQISKSLLLENWIVGTFHGNLLFHDLGAGYIGVHSL